MTATPVAGPAPDSLAPPPAIGLIDPAVLAKFDTLCSRMGLIADAVNAFTDAALRERAFYELVGIINPLPDEPEPVDVVAVPRWGDAPASAAAIGKLATWICDKAPAAWRDSIQPGESTVDAAIRFLADGDKARAELLLVRHALVEHGGFSAEQADGNLVALIQELAADPPVSSPEVEQLAAHLRAEAEPGETAAQVALRLIAELRQRKADDRGDGADAQPDGINAAIQAYKDRTGTS